MRTHIKAFALLLFSASIPFVQGQTPSATPQGPQAPERVAADTPKTTVMGNTFIAPKDWTVTVKGPATVLGRPSGF